MKRRQWTGKQKLQIVLEGLGGKVPRGNFVRAIESARHNITSGGINCSIRGPRVFDRGGPEQTEQRLREERIEDPRAAWGFTGKAQEGNMVTHV